MEKFHGSYKGLKLPSIFVGRGCGPEIVPRPKLGKKKVQTCLLGVALWGIYGKVPRGKSGSWDTMVMED
jgi:hypothetical protein